MNKLQENWLSIENFPNYEVSNLGNVRNKVSGKLKSKCIIRGYYYVDLHYKGKRKNIRLARVVANAFLPNIKNIDGLLNMVNAELINNTLKPL